MIEQIAAREFRQQAFSVGFAAVNGECTVDDQLFDIATIPHPTAQHDLASRPVVTGDGLNRLH